MLKVSAIDKVILRFIVLTLFRLSNGKAGDFDTQTVAVATTELIFMVSLSKNEWGGSQTTFLFLHGVEK